MILSAHCTAEATRDSVLGLGFESKRSSVVFKWRATSIPATIASTRLRPSSTGDRVSYSLFLRHSELGLQGQDTRTRYLVHSRPGCRRAREYSPGRMPLTSTSARKLTT